MTGIGAHHFTLLGCRLCVRAPSQRPEFEKFVILKGDRWLPLSRMNRLRTVKQKSSNRQIFIFINTKKKCRFRNGSFVKSHLENRLFGQKLAPVVPQIWRIPSSKPRPISMVHWSPTTSCTIWFPSHWVGEKSHFLVKVAFFIIPQKPSKPSLNTYPPVSSNMAGTFFHFR